MKRPDVESQAADDAAVRATTGRGYEQWFSHIDETGAKGRAAVGKVLQAEKVDPWWIATITVEYERARGIVEKDGRPKGYSLCATKTVAVPAARAFRAFTDAKELDSWFGPGTRIDAEPGGALVNDDGNRAEVSKVRPDKALVMDVASDDLAAGSRIEVLFQPKGDKTGLVVNHTRIEDRAAADALRAAWGDALDRLKAHLEA